MACEGFRSKMREFLDDLVDEPDHRQIAAHLRSCASCFAYASSIGTLSFRLHELGRTAAPPDLASIVAFEAKKRSSSRIPKEEAAVPSAPLPWRWILAALALIAVFAAYSRFRPEPPASPAAPAPSEEKKGYYTFYVQKESGEADGQDPDHR